MTDLMGAWEAFKCVSKDDDAAAVFAEATKDLVGVDYIPVAVATQVVSGINYRFFCNSRVVIPHARNGAAIVEIYAPLNGIPFVTGINSIFG